MVSGLTPALILRVAARPRLVAALDATGARLRARGRSVGIYVQAIARALRPLEQPASRRAFLQTLRSVIDVHGQRVSARDRLYLLGDMPTLVVWGMRDRTIPLEHGVAAHGAIPGSRFVTIPGAAHFPHLERPHELAAALLDFIAATEPARFDEDAWQALLRGRSLARPRSAA